MKLPFLFLILVAFIASPLCGQTSPAPAAPKTSTAESSTLTKAERDRAVE
jgi:hypothetical protein